MKFVKQGTLIITDTWGAYAYLKQSNKYSYDTIKLCWSSKSVHTQTIEGTLSKLKKFCHSLNSSQVIKLFKWWSYSWVQI